MAHMHSPELGAAFLSAFPLPINTTRVSELIMPGLVVAVTPACHARTTLINRCTPSGDAAGGALRKLV